MNKKIRERARELMGIGNNIDDKIRLIKNLEGDVEKLQNCYHEMGEQVIVRLVDQRCDPFDDLNMIEKAKELINYGSNTN